MSLGIALQAVRTTTVFDANYTNNVVPMWSKAGCYEALYESEGQKASEVLPVLEKALKEMRDDPKGYRALNPTNGWGSYSNALAWLEKLVQGFRDNPDGVISVYK